MAQPFTLSMHRLDSFAILLMALFGAIYLQTAQGGLSSYGGKCTNYSECSETGYCDKQSFRCVCQSFPGKLTQIFNEQSRKCESIVGSLCTLRPGPQGVHWNCVQDAECKVRNAGSDQLGLCACKSEWSLRDGKCEDPEKDLREFKARRASKAALSSTNRVNSISLCLIVTTFLLTWRSISM